jgi:multiple sugar transport system permease protein
VSRENRAWAFVAYPLAVIVLFSALPAVAGVAVSFFELSADSGMRWVGLGNYRAALTQDPLLRAAVRNSLLFALGAVPVQVAVGFGLAVALNAPWFRGKAICQTLVFLPVVVSVVAIGFVWSWVLDAQSGLLNALLSATGLGRLLFDGRPPLWLGDSPWALGSLVGIHVWRHVGFCMVLYLASLGRIPRSQYEALALDGGSSWQAIRWVTWPAVRPMTAFLAITGVIGALQVFDLVYMMTGGGGRWTTVLNVQLYEEFSNNRLGYAATLGVGVLLLSAVVTLAQLRWFRRQDNSA